MPRFTIQIKKRNSLVFLYGTEPDVKKQAPRPPDRRRIKKNTRAGFECFLSIFSVATMLCYNINKMNLRISFNLVVIVAQNISRDVIFVTFS